ncbi:MAG: VWA domain-containing protein [Fimbriimonadaceae bacterium]|nr:VWA domain-containing protein [Fimbriimonadaceae bacterium]
MNHTRTVLPGLEVTLVAHKDEIHSLLLATLEATKSESLAVRTPLRIALVIDKSGSMGGDKLEITKAAVAQFIRTLAPEDRVAVVAYDDQVDVLCGLEAPTEALAHRVEHLRTGGSTNLYGGWVTGAKIVGNGGRVILLSDGMANVGRLTDAQSLSKHALISFENYGVTTTTIGVGRDYDEGLMAGMAQAGGGAHYFAHTAESITEAFDQERYSASAVVLERLTIKCNGVDEQLGHFWGGETKKRVFEVKDLSSLDFKIHYLNKETGQQVSDSVTLPVAFGHSDEATLELLLRQASKAEGEMLSVRNPNAATQMKERLRGIVLNILAHPKSDEPMVAGVISRLKASIARLEVLERNYIEEEAMLHRKRSMQTSFNMRERAKGFSSFEDEKDMVRETAMAYSQKIANERLEFAIPALELAPLDSWIQWRAIPIEVTDNLITVAMEDSRKGFLISEIERATNRRVQAVFTTRSVEEILRDFRTQRTLFS